MKHYVGTRTDRGCTVVVRDGKCERPLAPRLDLWNHSPSGYEWGYGGSGPAQLALALAAVALGDDEEAVRVHQQLKWKLTAKLPREGFLVSEADVLRLLEDEGRDETV